MLDLKDLQKKDLAIDYRRVFTGTAVIEITSGSTVEKKIQVDLESTPFGKDHIRVSLLENIDFPLVPVLREIKAYVTKLNEKGQLH